MLSRLFASSASLAALVGTVPAVAQPLAKPAPLAAIARQVRIPFEQFTLANGLRVVVAPDRTSPVVGVSVWYHVGSKDEPAGKTGFAHLFEHLMFSGTENAPGSMIAQMEQIGATDLNGTTYFDRTNYFETVPPAALERALFLESDRMGHLLGAVPQVQLDRQRAVVQNEKRQGDDEPYGLVDYAQLEALFPDGHPYHHTTIGSMADLNGASLADVRQWFRGHYGPNNAVLVLAGNVEVGTARTLAQRYFGDLPRGPQPAPTPAAVPTLPAPKAETLHDQVATTRLYRMWAVPGLTDAATVPLDVFASVLGGLASSRFDDVLVRREKSAVSASASVNPLERVGMFTIQIDVAPGVDPKAAGARADAVMAELIARGPTDDEIRRAVTQEVSGRLFRLQQVGGLGGRAATLAEGAVYANDPGFYEKQLAQYAAVTPAAVRDAAKHWLTRPVYALTVVPGPRPAAEEAKAVQADAGSAPAAAREPAASPAPPAAKPTRTAPPVGEVATLNFPAVTRAKLSNGIGVVYAQRPSLPLSFVVLSFDAGHAADPRTALGTDELMLELLDQGTTTRDAATIAADQERLGARISTDASMDRATIALAGLSANLDPELDLLADVTLNPSFADLDRVRVQQLTAIRAEITDPTGLAGRTVPGLIYGGYPYGVPGGGSGDPAVVRRLTKADLAAFKAKWVRPQTATIFVVSDQPLARIQPLLERRFGGWKAPAGAAGVKDLSTPVPPPRPRVVLIDRPGSAQSVIYAGAVLDQRGTDGLLPLIAANDPIGGGFQSRLNTDLREQKGWSYGVQSVVSQYVGRAPYLVVAPVQTDKTGASIQAILADVTATLGAKPLTQEERDRSVERTTRQLPGGFESGADLIAAMQRNDRLKRPDDFYVHLADRYRALTTADLNRIARMNLDPRRLTWVVVGDAAKVRPQLVATGLAVEEMKPPAAE